MKLEESKVGTKCVVNDLEDATIFEIKDRDRFLVTLIYHEDGKEHYGGVMDISLLKHPSKKQIAYAEKHSS